MHRDEFLTESERLAAALHESRRLRRDAARFCQQVRRELRKEDEHLLDLALLAKTIAKVSESRPGGNS